MVTVKDEEGNTATAHEFQINNESLDGFTGDLDGEWELAAGGKGTATILFIPTKYAAPTSDKLYSFGGSLSYLDPNTGLTVTRDLDPVTLTVKPSPNLDLTYFMQRDIYGDDPLTKNVVEPIVPAEFALLINNVGYGDATNVRMTTQQPEDHREREGTAYRLRTALQPTERRREDSGVGQQRADRLRYDTRSVYQLRPMVVHLYPARPLPRLQR